MAVVDQARQFVYVRPFKAAGPLPPDREVALQQLAPEVVEQLLLASLGTISKGPTIPKGSILKITASILNSERIDTPYLGTLDPYRMDLGPPKYSQ